MNKVLEPLPVKAKKNHNGLTLIELAIKHAKNAGKAKKVNIANRVDNILYGAKQVHP